MKLRLTVLLLLLSQLGSAGSAWAQVYRSDLPPEERRQMRQQMRDHWQQERDVRRDDGARRWQEVPPEDRRRLREEMREQRHWQENREGQGWRGGRRD